MKSVRMFFVMVFALAAAGCANDTGRWLDGPLKDTSWQLMTIQANQGDQGREFVGNSVDIRMTLNATGMADFILGCDQGTTRWNAEFERVPGQGDIRFYGMQIAASSCEPDLIVQRFLRDFDFMQSYVLAQNHLWINTQANEVTYGWRLIDK
jgi:hypothetical protein